MFELDGSNCLKGSANNVGNFDILNGKNSTYQDFFDKYLSKNVPCVIRNAIHDWESSKLWYRDGQINFNHLRRRYGTKDVTVYDCLKRYYNSQEVRNVKFTEYVDYFQRHGREDDAKLDYLKDWHLKLHTEDNFYEVPIFFASDWLNEYYVEVVKDDDYRFVYMGPKGTWTPFHQDVFSSYSWSANVCGKKKWLFFPPGAELALIDRLGNLPYDVVKENHTLPSHIELHQERGEIVFVPSGWYHQVWNLEDTISVNHNWINGCNIELMFGSLMKNLEAVRSQIEHCSDMEGYEEHCQLMLNSVFGMDFYKFYDFVKYIALSRINIIRGKVSNVLFHGHEIGRRHCIFDLKVLKEVLKLFVNNDEVQSLENFKSSDLEPVALLENVESVLQDECT